MTLNHIETKTIPTTSIPQTICFEPLYLCNIRCDYCYIGETNNVTTPTIPPINTTFQILSAIKEQKVQEIYLAGGEPLAHPNFEDICKKIAELDFPERGVVTNGTLITEEKATLLKDLDFWVNVSFRAHNSHLFDQITRSKGSFQKAMKGLVFLKNVGVIPAIEYDPVPSNYLHVYDTIKLLHDYGIPIREVWLHRISPHGDAMSSYSDGGLSIEQYQQVLKQAGEIKEQFGISAVFEDSIPLCIIDNDHHQFTTACDCGVTLANIDPLGNIRRCACHPKNLGNVLQTPLSDIWQLHLNNFRSREWLNPICKNCSLLEKCGGGCSVSLPSEDGYTNDKFSSAFKSI